MAVDLATSFTQFTLTGGSINNPTSLQFGPDGRLYVAQQDGLIKIFTVQRSEAGYVVTSTQTLSAIKDIPNHNDDGSLNTAVTSRQVTGLLVTGTSEHPVIYVGSSDPRIAVGHDSNLDTNSGILSRLTLDANGAWQKVDLVRGLPRSEENHSINGLQYDAASNALLIGVGGNTNMGAPSHSFGYLPEYSYSAAVLKVDLGALDAMSIKIDASSGKPQAYVYDLPTLNDPTREDDAETAFGGNDGLNMAKIAADSPVQIYSPGYRNAYDLVLTEGGKLYVMDNGPNKNWGGLPVIGPNGITNQVSANGGVTANDTLHLAAEGYYGGHPNPIRANGAAAGLTESDGDDSDGVVDGALRPTSELPADWEEIVASINAKEAEYHHPGGDAPALWTNGQSTNGIAEYTASNFGGALKGNLLTVGYGGSLYRLQLSEDGKSVTAVQSLSVGGTPLDVVAQGDGKPFAGSIWIAKYGADSISILEPSPPSSPPPVNDDDQDGILNQIDRFGLDPDNGHGTALLAGDTLSWSMSAADPDRPGPANNLFGVGFTGVMVDWQTPYASLYDIENLTPGGAAGVFTIDAVGAGTATGAVNSQREAFQFGISPDAGTRRFTVLSDMDNPFDTIAHPTDDQSQGIYIGTGDQDNFIRIAVHAHGGAGGIEVALENGGIATTVMYEAPGLIGAGATDGVTLSLDVNAEQGLVTPQWRYTTGNGAQIVQGSGDAVAVAGPLLEALQGWYTVNSQPSGLAVGIIATSDGEGSPFSASWDNVRIVAPPNTIVADHPDDLVGAGGNGKDVILYRGSADITALAAGIEDVNFASNGNAISVTGNALANVFTVGTGANVLRGGGGGDSFRGTAAALDGDRLTDFFTTDKIVVEGAGAGGKLLSFTQSTRKLAIDSDGDGDADATIIFDSSPFAKGTSLADFTTSIADGLMTIGYTPKAGAVVAAINSGGNSYFDADSGITYAADNGQYANGGGKYSTSTSIAGTNDQSLYANERYSSGDLLYNIPVANGDYVVTLKFAEIFGGITGAGQRLYDVRAEGETVLDDLDLYASAGLFHAYDWTGVVQVDDGMLSLDFLKGAAENPKVAAILIQEAGSLPPPGGATIKINSGAGIDTSTYNASAFQVTNTGSKAIVSITFDTHDNALPGVLFDPAGTAGDNATKNLKIDSFGATGAVQPAAGDHSAFSVGHDGGYERMTVTFNPAVNGGFNPGETVKFSVDIDPINIKGSGIDGDAGSISGLELLGSAVTVTYADGTTQTTQIFGDGSAGGGEATLGADMAPAPVLSLGGVSSGRIGVADATQTVAVSGRPGDVVKVLLMTGGSGNNVQPADMFDANKAIAVAYRTVALDSSGKGSLQVTLPPANPVYIAATVDNGGAGTGLVSPPLVVAWDSNTRTFVGTTSADIFTGAEGFHWIASGLAGHDTLTTQGGNDRLTGGAGNDTLSAGGGDDVILFSGTANGNDIVDGGAGDDRIEALADNSIIGLTSVTNVETITAGGWTGVKIVGTSGGDMFDFSAVTLTGISLIDGGKGNDTIIGSDGADVIAGGEGADTLAGGIGDDIFIVAALTGTDSFSGAAGFDRIVAVAANASINALALSGIEEISSGGFAGVSLVGSAANDTIDLSGIALLGISAIDAGNGSDSVTGSAGADILIGGAGNDSLAGQDGDDIFRIGAGAGIDSFDGGEGLDQVVATAANVTITATRFSNIETISSGGFAGVTIAGTAANESFDFTGTTLIGIGAIEAGAGDDLLLGSAGNDTLRGGAGNDEIGGGGGSNILTGNEGADLFRLVLRAADGNSDQVTDFTVGSDRLVIAGADFALTGADVTAGGFLKAQRLVQGIDPSGHQGQFLYSASSGVLSWDADGIGDASATVIATLGAGVALQASDILIRGLTPPPTEDVSAPTATAVVLDLTAPSASHVIVVTYADEGSGVDLVTIGTDDLSVTGPTGVSVTSVATSVGANGVISAEYVLAADEGFDAQDNGTFAVSLVAGAVKDLDGNGVSAAPLASFAVDIVVSGNVIEGTSAGEKLTGTAAAETIYGRGGNDTLDGGAGADALYGGTGSDTYYVEDPGDLVVELAGEGNDLVNSYIGYTLPENVENIFLRGSATIDGIGNSLGNRMEGNDASNLLDGQDGADILIGRGGADRLRGGAGNDIFDYNLASDSRGSAIDLILDFVQGEDRIDLATIDASSALAGNQAFAFIGSAAFSGRAGELRSVIETPGTSALYADIDGNGIADMHIRVSGDWQFQSSDFLL